MPNKTALVVVDVQNDFITGSMALKNCPAGQDGVEVVPLINRILNEYVFDTVVYTMDCHPPDHMSFKEWPVHCVLGTRGQELHPGLNQDPKTKSGTMMIMKGTEPDVDSYSAFWDNEHEQESALREQLQKSKIDTLLICGLAFDYCVYFTALDAAKAGFKTYIIEDCCRSTQPDVSTELIHKKQALDEAGVKLITIDDVADYI